MTTPSLEEIRQLERSARKHCNELREKMVAMEAELRDQQLDALKPLAIRAHDLLCGYNHTDGCAWGYECSNGQHSWTSQAHARWLEKIERLTKDEGYRKGIPLEKLDAILSVVAQAKEIHGDFLFVLGQLRSM